jgi:hypothetical protein
MGAGDSRWMISLWLASATSARTSSLDRIRAGSAGWPRLAVYTICFTSWGARGSNPEPMGKSSPAQHYGRTTCTDATVKRRSWLSLHPFRRCAVPRPVPRVTSRDLFSGTRSVTAARVDPTRAVANCSSAEESGPAPTVNPGVSLAQLRRRYPDVRPAAQGRGRAASPLPENKPPHHSGDGEGLGGNRPVSPEIG